VDWIAPAPQAMSDDYWMGEQASSDSVEWQSRMLGEKEWPDADREFYGIALSELESLHSLKAIDRT
jgi:hypothetical protein